MIFCEFFVIGSHESKMCYIVVNVLSALMFMGFFCFRGKPEGPRVNHLRYFGNIAGYNGVSIECYLVNKILCKYYHMKS